MRKSYRFLVVALISYLFSTTAFAQNIIITGNVRNGSSQEAVPAVSVVVKGTSQGTFTDPDGDFSLNVAKLPVTLVLSSVGYDNQEVTVSDASAKIQVDFKPNISLGQEVVVAANRTPTRILESPVTIERMSTSIIRNVAAPNFYDAITNLKGVDMHTASLTFKTPTTRGFLGSGNIRLNQLVDGMDNQAPGLNFSVGSIVGPNELDVDNVELLAGASSALYGSGGMNGTLLINSKNPFKYQGFSFNIKQGIMHINDPSGQEASPYYDWSFRWAKAINDKWAFKLAGAIVSATDWGANDDRNKVREPGNFVSKVVGGNRGNDPNYNGVNVYGDEANANMGQLAALVVGQAPPALVSAASNYFGPLGNYPTDAQREVFLSGFPADQRDDLKNKFLPFFIGSQKGYFGNGSVSRTGYAEKDLVDYNNLNARFTVALHYKITPGIEASINSNFGTGTTVYTGADRYSLRNFRMAQHKLEVRSKSWYVRGYTTQENAGGSYNATALGVYINNKWKGDQDWFTEYIASFSEARRLGQGNISDVQAHSTARVFADQGRLIPGTPTFDAALKEGRSVPISDHGALFLDKTDLWAGDAQLNLSDAGGFSDKVEMIVGAQWKQYVLNSGGTIFADTTGVIKINEYGGYVQLRKALLNDALTLTAAGRYDKQSRFNGRFTPRFTAVIKVAKDNNIRLSYQTAYRFPTTQDQYISLETGAGILIGCFPEFQTFYGLNSPARPAYTAKSIDAFRGSQNPADLVQAEFRAVKPETVNSYEVGYKGILGGRLLVDAYGYYSVYKNYLQTVGVGQSDIPGTPVGLISDLSMTSISYKQNFEGGVKIIGWGIGLEYQLPKGFSLYGNVFSDQLRGNLPDDFVSFFNAPKYRFNIGLRNENVFKNIGFNVVAKWQDNSFYEGTFVTGTLPYFTWVDAQVTYRCPKTKSTFRIGGTNVGNNYYRTGYGSPYVGGLYYVSYGYNL